ncbi:MAG: glycosyltransferase family 4 protein [Bacteroidales bacterium]|nr:glycosyltransferase family 4 protein [Bacteroidales bacterium]
MLSYLDLWSLAEGKGAPSFFNTVKAYVDDGWNITLIQPKSKYRQDYKVEGCRMIKFNNTFFDFCNKIPKVRFFMKFLAFYYVTFQFYKKANEIISKNKKNYIIYSYEVHAVKAGAKLAKKYNFPLITRFQGTILTEKPYNLLNRIIKFPHYEALKRKSDIVIMTNDGTRGDEVLKRLHNKSEKVLFWKNGQDPIKPAKEIKEKRSEIRTKYGIAMETPIMLTVSRLQSWKRVDRAIVAMEKVVKEYPKAKLIVVGSGEEYNNLVNLSKELNLKDNIIFTGAVKQEEVWMYYSCADIFLSLYDLSNVGNPLMEAMRYGKAIITLDNGDTGTIIKHNENGVLLSPNELKTVSDEILNLIKDGARRVRLGEKAFEYSKNNFWSWEERIRTEIIEVNKLLNK